MMLYEKHRPRNWNEFAGNERTIKAIRRQADQPDYTGGAYWISGPSGTGKTSLAWILARQFADDFDVVELDGDKCNVESVRDLEKSISLSGMFGAGWKVVIVNEAHAMTSRAVQAWLTLLERLPARRIVIFTTTDQQADLFGDYGGPLFSRCLTFALSSYGLKESFAARALEIARAEGLDGQPLAKYERLVSDCKNNMRAVLSAIESGKMLAD